METPGLSNYRALLRITKVQSAHIIISSSVSNVDGFSISSAAPVASCAWLQKDLRSSGTKSSFMADAMPVEATDGIDSPSKHPMSKTLETFLSSEPKVAAKIEHAIQDYKHARNDLAHALEDLKHAKQDTAHALKDFDHLINDFEHAVSDWETGGKQAAHAANDLEHAGTDKSHAAEDLEHALKDIAHALTDFKHAMRDLSHLDEHLESVVALAKKAGVEITLVNAKSYVAAQAKA
jgi:methyl-accepting chemotaxis protein